MRVAAETIAEIISNCAARLAHYRAVAALHRPRERGEILAGCEQLRVETDDARRNLSELRLTLPARLREHSRLIDLDKSLAAMEAAIDDIRDVLAG